VDIVGRVDVFVVWVMEGLAKRKRLAGDTYSKAVSVNVIHLHKRKLMVMRIVMTPRGARALGPKTSRQ
jgi:hypothetical protein